MTEEKTFTTADVDNIIKGIQFRERVISALLTAIQRSVAAGDEPMYTNALRVVLDAQFRASTQKPDEQKPEGQNEPAEPE